MPSVVSTVNPTIPVDGQDVDAPPIRLNFLAAKNDIDALNTRVDALTGTPTPTPTPTPSPTESPEGTRVTSVGSSISNTINEAFTITQNAQVAVNNSIDNTTQSVEQLYYHAHQIYYQDAPLLGWHVKTVGSDPWTSSSAPYTAPAVGAYSQTPNSPISGPIPSGGSRQPFGVTLVNPNTLAFDGQMGTQASSTIKSLSDLKKTAYFRNTSGDLTNANTGRTMVGFDGVMADYPATLSDGVTPDPRCLHVFGPDYLGLIARSNIPGLSSDSSVFEVGYIRIPVPLTVGSYCEVEMTMPANAYAVPLFDAFTVEQVTGANDLRFATPQLEIDIVQGIRPDNTAAGSYLTCGAPIFADPSLYGNPYDQFASNGPSFTKNAVADGGSGMTLWTTIPASDPTMARHYFAIERRDQNTLLYIYDGQVVKVRHVANTATYSQTSGMWTGTPPSNSQLGQLVPMAVYIVNQIGYQANTTDYAALHANAANQFNTLFVHKIGLWNSISNAAVPSGTSVSPLPPPQTGGVLDGLPQLTSATYVARVHAGKSNPISDRIGGNAVRLNGLAAWSSAGGNQVNSKSTIVLQANGTISLIGPVCGYAQGTGQIAVYLILKQTNPTQSTPQFLAQFNTASPASDQDHDKITLAMTAFAGASVADFETHGVNYGAFLLDDAGDLVSCHKGTFSGTHVDFVGMKKLVTAAGLVRLGQSYSQDKMLPATSGGVPATTIPGYTELLIGGGRDNTGVAVNLTSALICEIIVVGFTGPDISSVDEGLLAAYATSEWGAVASGPSSTANDSPAGYLPQGPAVTSLNGTSFFWFNQLAAGFTGGGGNTPIVLSAPDHTGNAPSALVTPITGTGSYTWLLNEPFGDIQYFDIGPAIFLAGSPSFVSFTFNRPTGAGANVGVYHWLTLTNPDPGNALAQAPHSPCVPNTDFYARIVWDSAAQTYNFLHSATGAHNSWTSLTVQNASVFGPLNYIGVHINPNDLQGAGIPISVTIKSYAYTLSTDPQAGV